MVEDWNISEKRGGPEVFLEIAPIAQFLSDIEKEGIKLFKRAIPFYPDTIKIGIHHIRGGGARQFLYEQFFRGNLKIDGLPPPNVVDTIFFGIWIGGDCSSEQNEGVLQPASPKFSGSLTQVGR